MGEQLCLFTPEEMAKLLPKFEIIPSGTFIFDNPERLLELDFKFMDSKNNEETRWN